MDIKELPKINKQKKYLFVAIDRKTRICVIKIYETKDTKSAVDFLNFCVNTFPFKITKVLTDNGQCFTDRFARGRNFPSGNHLFDVACKNLNIEHRLTKPYSPHTNGMVERMNARFNDNVLSKFIFNSYSQLEASILKYIYHYNFFLKQKALNFLSPVNFLIKYVKINSDKYKNFNIFASEFMNLFRYNDTRIDRSRG